VIPLHVAHTWNGAPLTAAERTTLRLRDGLDALDIEIDAPFAGDPAPPGKGSTPRLWEHEVVELFVFGADDRYTEIELGPHGHWLVLRFDGVRSLVDEGHAITFDARIAGERWAGTARVPREILPARPARCNAFRIAGIGTGRRYEALVPVPGDRPDFHRPDIGLPWAFAL
jgi:hypothetical protein